MKTKDPYTSALDLGLACAKRSRLGVALRRSLAVGVFLKVFRLMFSRLVCGLALVLLDLLLAVAILIMLLAWLLDPFRFNLGPMHLTIHGGLKPILVLVLILGVRRLLAWAFARGYPHVRGLWESAVFKKICFSLITTYVVFILFESVLVWTRFDAALPPIIFQGKINNSLETPADTIPDAELIYRFKPGIDFGGRRINSLGFRDREVDPRKEPGTIRVICMGDSVTGQGQPGYSQYLHERLTNNPPTPGAWEAFNMGVYGYSSLQGLRLFQKTGRFLDPDIVTLFYGWNSHWLADEPDRQRMGLEMRPFAGRIFELLRQKRIFRLVVWALNPVQHLAARKREDARVPRVAPDEYLATLKAFVREIRAAGAFPILITAPRRSLTQNVVDKKHVISVEQGNRVHDEYVEITRRAALDANVELLDLASLFTNQACDVYFAPDGIHFDYYAEEEHMTNNPPSQLGLMRIAAELDKKVRDITRSPSWQTQRPASL
ncbi:MAG: GDSL-type esterase/lipase family protein [Kiritimatiellae bacterium]|nr:GDSL-type esterase/lipase family protein [Kiritimatiellia bacterium]